MNKANDNDEYDKNQADDWVSQRKSGAALRQLQEREFFNAMIGDWDKLTLEPIPLSFWNTEPDEPSVR